MLKAVVFGKRIVRLQDRLQSNTNFVPTYESRNSLALSQLILRTIICVHRKCRGKLGESPAQHHTLDIGVGRLPVKHHGTKNSSIKLYLRFKQKIPWPVEKDIVFVGDDGSNSDTSPAPPISGECHGWNMNLQILNLTPKIFLGSIKTESPTGRLSPRRHRDIQDRFSRGALIINFTGMEMNSVGWWEGFFQIKRLENFKTGLSVLSPPLRASLDAQMTLPLCQARSKLFFVRMPVRSDLSRRPAPSTQPPTSFWIRNSTRHCFKRMLQNTPL